MEVNKLDMEILSGGERLPIFEIIQRFRTDGSCEHLIQDALVLLAANTSVDENKTSLPILDRTLRATEADGQSGQCPKSQHQFKLHDWRWIGWPLGSPSCDERWCAICGLRQIPLNGKWVSNAANPSTQATASPKAGNSTTVPDHSPAFSPESGSAKSIAAGSEVHWALQSGVNEAACGAQITPDVLTSVIGDMGVTCPLCQSAFVGYKFGRAAGSESTGADSSLVTDFRLLRRLLTSEQSSIGSTKETI